MDGKPVAGADQLGVFELFAQRRLTVTEATPRITEAVDGSISVPQGERLSVHVAAGVLESRALVLTVNVPVGGALAISLNGEVHELYAGEHMFKLPKTSSAVELLVSADVGTSTLLSLKKACGTMIVFQ